MSFKEFSSSQGAPSKEDPNAKSKVKPKTDQPAEQTDKSPAEAVPEAKS